MATKDSNEPTTSTRAEQLRSITRLFIRLNRDDQSSVAAVISGLWLSDRPDRLAEVEQWMRAERERETELQTEQGKREAARLSRMIDQELIALHLEKYGTRRMRPARRAE